MNEVAPVRHTDNVICAGAVLLAEEYCSLQDYLRGKIYFTSHFVKQDGFYKHFWKQSIVESGTGSVWHIEKPCRVMRPSSPIVYTLAKSFGQSWYPASLGVRTERAQREPTPPKHPPYTGATQSPHHYYLQFAFLAAFP